MRATGPKKPIASGAMAIHDPAPSIIMTADQIAAPWITFKTATKRTE